MVLRGGGARARSWGKSLSGARERAVAQPLGDRCSFVSLATTASPTLSRPAQHAVRSGCRAPIVFLCASLCGFGCPQVVQEQRRRLVALATLISLPDSQPVWLTLFG